MRVPSSDDPKVFPPPLVPDSHSFERLDPLIAAATEHAIFRIDTQGILQSWNPGVERILGYAEAEWVGQSATILFTPEDRANNEPERELANAAENGRAEDLRWHLRKNGTRFWADGVVTPLYDETGTLIGFGKVMRDATDRKRAQVALRDAEERLRLAAEAARVGTWDFNPVSGELRWDERCKALFGLPPDAPVDYTIFLAGLHPEDRAHADETVRRVLDPASGAGGEYDIEYRTVGLADGGVVRWIAATGKAFFDAEGVAERFIGTVIDISASKAAEATLREREQYLRRLIESSPDCIKMLDLDGRILSMSESGRRLLELPATVDLCGMDWVALWPEGEATAVLSAALETARSGGTGRFQAQGPTYQGNMRWWDVVIAPILDADGKPEKLFSASRDITERKLAEDKLRAAHAQTFETLESIRDAFYAVDADFRFTYVNRKAEELWNRCREDLIGKHFGTEFPEAVNTESYEWHLRVARERRPAHFETASSLVDRPVEVSIYPTDNGGLSVYFRDISARKALEAERERLLAEQRARAEREALLNQIGEAVRATREPDAVLRAAVEALGKALGADRCYYVTYEKRRDHGRIGPDWHRANSELRSIAGEYRMSDYAVNREVGYQRGKTQVIDDLHTHVVTAPVATEGDAPPVSLMDELGLRALLRAPLLSDGVMTALVVAMANTGRHWTEDEVRLVEAVAAQTRAAVEAARIQQRERNIAAQLQEALQPPPPDDLPGLALSSTLR